MVFTKIHLLCLLAMFFADCAKVDAVKSIKTLPTPTSTSTLGPPTKIPLNEIDLAKIGFMADKGRPQDPAYNKDLPVVEELLAHGKEAIPYLISKLDDNTKIDYQIVNLWNRAYVGDVAFILLTEFFLEEDEEVSTIKGMDWDTFLERGRDRNVTGEGLLRHYIDKHGRKEIKRRWQEVWENNKDRIYWDEKKLNFRLQEK